MGGVQSQGRPRYSLFLGRREESKNAHVKRTFQRKWERKKNHKVEEDNGSEVQRKLENKFISNQTTKIFPKGPTSGQINSKDKKISEDQLKIERKRTNHSYLQQVIRIREQGEEEKVEGEKEVFLIK